MKYFLRALFIFALPTLAAMADDGYERAKQAYLNEFNLIEPSPVIYEIVTQALKNCTITLPVIILEDPKPGVDYEGFVHEARPYSLFVLASLRNDTIEERNSKIWIAHHECGHLHHHHHAHRILVDKLTAQTSNTTSPQPFDKKPALLATKTLMEKIHDDFDIPGHFKDQEKQADLFACEHLIKNGREDIVLQAIIAPHAHEKDVEHPSAEESRAYLSEYLMKNGTMSPALYEQGLKFAITFNKREYVDQMLHEGALPDTANASGFTALHRAVQNGDTEQTRELLSAHASVDARDTKGLTPLMWAIEFNKPANVTMLISHGAQINATDHNGFTPLHQAVLWSRPPIVKLLLASGANRLMRDHEGRTPRDLAVNKQKPELINLF